MIGVDVAIARDGSHAYTADGARYSSTELDILIRRGGLSARVHRLKRIFSGTIIGVETDGE